MITQQDIKTVEAIKKQIDSEILVSGKPVNWDAIEKIETLDRLVNNLRIANVSYREASDEDIAQNYYTAECINCGWYGSPRLLCGGGEIADTGDHFDPTCPVCGNCEIDERFN